MKGWNELCLTQRPNVLYALLLFKFCQGETTWDVGQPEERIENRPTHYPEHWVSARKQGWLQLDWDNEMMPERALNAISRG